MALLVFALVGCNKGGHDSKGADPTHAGYLFECTGYNNTGKACTKAWVPAVLSFGDSQNIGYSVGARQYLYDTADFRHDDCQFVGRALPARPVGFCGHYNDGNAIQLAARMRTILPDHFYSVITFNSGIHDFRLNGLGTPHVPLDVYKKEIEAAAQLAGQHANIVIWIDTMPSYAGINPAERIPVGGEIPYNQAADAIAKAHGFYILHMHDAEHRPHDIHYTRDGSFALGKQVAECVKLALTNSGSATCHH